MSSSLKFRTAKIWDFEVVMNIDRDIYHGFDYLENTYPWHVRDENSLAIVGTLDGKVVAFVTYLLSPDGTAIVGQAARIRPEIRGTDAIKRLNAYGKAKAQERWPSAVKSIGLMFVTEAVKRLVQNIQLPTRVVGYWMVFLTHSTTSKLLSLRKPSGSKTKDVFLFSSDQLKNRYIQQMTDVLLGMSSHFYFGSTGLPLEVNEEHAKYAAMQCDVIVSFPKSSNENSQQSQMTSFSFITMEQMSYGYRGTMQYNGQSTEDYLEHLIRYFNWMCEHVPQSGNDNIKFLLSIPRILNIEAIVEFLSVHIGQTSSSEVVMTSTSNESPRPQL